jgi:lytic murein transglycosylase
MRFGLRVRGLVAALTIGTSVIAASAASAAVPCQKDGPFDKWLADVKAEAAAKGVSRAAIETGLAGVAFDPSIVRRDRGQGVFQQSFLQFSDRMVSADRMSRGKKMLQTHAALFSRIEKQYGVPPEVLVAFWGLETDFGSDLGKLPVITAVATLAYDCRRPDFFRPELIDLLRIVERGDLKPSEMLGDWAGELGHMQFTPTDYFKYGVDYDGDGRRDVRNSVPDAMASAANFLVGLGWRRGEPWLEEVHVPANLPWQDAGLDVTHTRQEWAKAGVTRTGGRPLTADGLPASLILPMGRLGPAFLAYPNFQAYLGWNKAMVYSTTAAYYATRLDGAAPVTRGSAPGMMTTEQMRELQTLLHRQGFSNEPADGRLGNATRAAVKQAQLKYGLPADSYPTVELLAAMRAGR